MSGSLFGFDFSLHDALYPLSLGYNIYASEKNRDDQNSLVHYQKMMNQVQMDREDNAIQRRTKDMRKAGINPLLAAGNPASSSSVSTPSAPARVPQRVSPMDLLAYQQGKANVAKTDAETLVADATAKNLTEQNKNLQEINAKLSAETLESRARTAKLYAEMSGKTVDEAGFELFGLKWKSTTTTYNSVPEGSDVKPSAKSSGFSSRLKALSTGDFSQFR